MRENDLYGLINDKSSQLFGGNNYLGGFQSNVYNDSRDIAKHLGMINYPNDTAVLKHVKHNAEGLAFLKTLKTVLNDKFSIRVRGRGPRRSVARSEGVWPGRYDVSIPLDKAAWFSVYITPKEINSTVDYHSGYNTGVKIGILATLQVLERQGLLGLDSRINQEDFIGVMESLEANVDVLKKLTIRKGD